MRKFTIPGIPHGKGRPRFSTRDGFPKAYTDSKTAAYENLVALEYEKLYGGEKQMEGPIAVEITAYFPLSKSDYWPVNSRHNGELNQKGLDKLAGKEFPAFFDVDNLAKSCLDGLNKAAWRDDKQVVSLIVKKKYSETPREEVAIEELEQ